MKPRLTNYPWLESDASRLFERTLSQRLHHALLFVGRQGIGKLSLAKNLAKALLCQHMDHQGPCGKCQSCLLYDAGNHADYHELVSEKQLGVDSVRKAIAILSSKAHLSHNKVLVLPNAHGMTEAASNALLKTLEEPTANTYLLLLTPYPSRLLPTILSRCEKVKVSLPSQAQSIDWLIMQGIKDASPALLQAYGDAPLMVKAAIDNGDGTSYSEFLEEFKALLGGQQTVSVVAKRWQDDADMIIKWCQLEAHHRYVKSQHEGDFKIYSICSEARKTLQHPGVNKMLLLTSVLTAFI
jgi:DNA polymerase-3 subunit delta'